MMLEDFSKKKKCGKKRGGFNPFQSCGFSVQAERCLLHKRKN